MFSVFVKKWREDAGLNQEEAAARANIGQSAWAKFESVSYGQPRKETCFKIAKALGISDAVVLSAAGYDASHAESPVKQTEDTQILELMETIQRASRNVQPGKRRIFLDSIMKNVEVAAQLASA